MAALGMKHQLSVQPKPSVKAFETSVEVLEKKREHCKQWK